MWLLLRIPVVSVDTVSGSCVVRQLALITAAPPLTSASALIRRLLSTPQLQLSRRQITVAMMEIELD